ncbi:MAG: hypothetical protein R3A79_20860 [Nannocystaceae bacterium]
MQTLDLPAQAADYRRRLADGEIQATYGALMTYLQRLKTRFSKSLAAEFSVGNVFPGLLDVSYFYVASDALKRRGLKLGLVLRHADTSFEIWLLGQTKDVQRAYWEAFRAKGWASSAQMPAFAVVERTLVAAPDFGDLDALSRQLIAAFSEQAGELLAQARALRL